jgi:hypothetical protein
MKKTGHQRQDELRAELFAVAEYCPVAEDNPEECPLHLLRLKNTTQRLKWIGALTKADLGYLTTYCHICMNLKMAGPGDAGGRAVRV